MARATRPVSIDGIELDALMEESAPLEAEAPAYPVESGFEISDSIILKARTLSMTLFLTRTPVTWKSRHGTGPTRVQDAIKKLEELYFARKPVTVATWEKTWRNMAILSLDAPKSTDAGTSREVSITFQEVRVTESRTATVPDSYGKSGATGASAGAAGTTASESPAAPSQGAGSQGGSGGSKSSILYGLASSAGLV